MSLSRKYIEVCYKYFIHTARGQLSHQQGRLWGSSNCRARYLSCFTYTKQKSDQVASQQQLSRYLASPGLWTARSPVLSVGQEGRQGLTSGRCHFHTTGVSCIVEDRHTKSLAVWTNLHELKASPMPALTLGLSGLIPFMAAPAYMIMNSVFMANLATAQLAYGACILSFLGGVRWGFVLPEENPIQPDWVNLGYSVAPSLVAWCGLLVPQPLGLVTVMSGLALAAYADMAMYGYPAWFKGLRFLLSFVAILSLWSTFMCYFVIDARSPPKTVFTTDSEDK